MHNKFVIRFHYTAMLHMDSSFSNIEAMNNNVILEIQKELESYDIISLVFLLYEVPDTALQRLIIYQRISKDDCGRNCTLLSDWALHAQSRPTWKYEFLEALAICQCNSVIRKLGFDTAKVKMHYLPGNDYTGIYVHPIKKTLYKLCESMTSYDLQKLKKTFLTYDIDTADYECAELVLLELMSQKFISFGQNNKETEFAEAKCDVENLAKVIDNFQDLSIFSTKLRELEHRYNKNQKISQPLYASTPNKNMLNEPTTSTINDNTRNSAESMKDVLDLLNDLKMEDITSKDFESDNRKLNKILNEDMYAIKNPKRVGVCYIINQEDFHPSRDSIENNLSTVPLKTRHGSTRDSKVLEKTMTELNFEVICHRDLDHKKMMKQIKDIIQYRVHHDDSIFVLCLLSHGVKDHVYAADSVKVSVSDIQNLLESDLAQNLIGVPKVMIIEACQVNDTSPPPRFVADGPSLHHYNFIKSNNETRNNFHLKKSDFLIYWATAPELEAFRHEQKGSIFIQILCGVIQKHAASELYDIFTKVNNTVMKICSMINCDQVPIFKSTLRKKLYLRPPQ